MPADTFVPQMTIEIDQKQMDRYERALGRLPRGFEKVMSRALNKILVKAHNEIAKAIRADLPIKANELKRKYLRRFKARFKKLQARILVTGKRIPLSKLGAKKYRNIGVVWGKRGARQVIEHAFMATLKSGHEGAFIRKSKARLPIRELRGPSIPQVFEDLGQFGSMYEARLVNDLAEELLTQATVLLQQEGF